MDICATCWIEFFLSWTEEFLLHGGYDALLARLKEILGVEWR